MAFARAQPGSPDVTFNATATAGHWGYSVAVQPDGKVIGAGSFGLFRFLDNGSVDPSFTLPFPAGQSIAAVALQSDGKVVVRGDVTNATGAVLPGIMRLNSDGSIDGTFQLDPGVHPSGRALVVQPGGKILSGGVSFVPGQPDERAGPFRLEADGSLDVAFDASWFERSAPLTALALAPEGQIYFSTESFSPEYGSANEDGSPNLLFNPEPGIGPWGAIALQQDGRIMVGQYSDGSTFTPIRRLLPNGSDDPDWTPPQLGGGDALVRAILVQPDGKVLAGGNNLMSFNGVANPSIGRLLPNGAVDLTFDAGAGLHYYSVEAMVLAPDGKLVVAGFNQSSTNTESQGGIWRLNNDTGPRGIEFTGTSYIVREGERIAEITVSRAGPATKKASVHYDALPTTATHGRDYSVVGNRLDFRPGETQKSFHVRIKKDNRVEEFEVIYLRLTKASGGVIGPRSTATLTILDQ